MRLQRLSDRQACVLGHVLYGVWLAGCAALGGALALTVREVVRRGRA